MEYKIEVDEALNNVLKSNAEAMGKSVEEIICSIVKRYAIDMHIMEKTELWQDGINDCADINLDWANL